mmetsp:Transcript_44656/g.129183  ORF Transcript_44656/g.129183 Transcript_44656/m.129183 type:complete len:279 (+) Transcript_44656:115-951(+)
MAKRTPASSLKATPPHTQVASHAASAILTAPVLGVVLAGLRAQVRVADGPQRWGLLFGHEGAHAGAKGGGGAVRGSFMLASGVGLWRRSVRRCHCGRRRGEVHAHGGGRPLDLAHLLARGLPVPDAQVAAGAVGAVPAAGLPPNVLASCPARVRMAHRAEGDQDLLLLWGCTPFGLREWLCLQRLLAPAPAVSVHGHARHGRRRHRRRRHRWPWRGAQQGPVPADPSGLVLREEHLVGLAALPRGAPQLVPGLSQGPLLLHSVEPHPQALHVAIHVEG